MKFERMRFDNDCSIASVSMAIKKPYEQCLKIAIKNGFIPNHKYGFDVATLLIKSGCMRFHCSPFQLKLLQSPAIVSIKSRNNPGGFHAVVVSHGKVYDPSNLKTADIDYIMRNYRHSYFGFNDIRND